MDLLTRTGSIEMEHGSGKQNMDLVVPFEMEHGSQVLKKYGLFVIRLVDLVIIPCGSSFFN